MSAGILGKKKRRGDQDFYLQITSLIDTLVIILVFMLMTVGTGSVNLELASKLTLPWASQGSELTPGVKVIARMDGVYIDETKVADFNKGEAVGGTTSEAGKKITPLFQKLAEIAQASKKTAENSKVKFEGTVLIQADKDVPLKTIKQVLYSAARAGFHDFKFAVRQ